jgi:hypothetical protein
MEKQSNSYRFLEKVADEMMDNIQLSPPVVEHGDPYYDFWFGWDNNMTYRLSINDLEKMRERGQPLVEITKDILSQTISDFFVLFEDRYGYFNIEDIVNVLARFFIPKLYNRYLKEDDTPDAPIVIRENKNVDSLIDKVVRDIEKNFRYGKESINFNTVDYGFRDSDLSRNIDFYYDPYHSTLGVFDYEYVLSTLSNLVAYYLFKTMGIGEPKRIQNRHFDDPMVAPIAKKLTQNTYKIAKEKGYVRKLVNLRSSLTEQTAPQIRQNVGKVYHNNGFINRIVTDILKMTVLRSFKVLFDFSGLGFSGGHHLPQLLYRWDENKGLTEDSINVLRRNIPELVKQYLSKQSMLSGDDDPTVPIISEILSDEIIEQINNYQRDEEWEHWNEEWILAEEKRGSVLNKQKQYLDKVKKKVVDSLSEDDRFWNFNDMIEPTYDDNVAPVRLKKQGILSSLNGDWLFNRFRDHYGDIYGLSHIEVEEIYNAALYHIFKKNSLNAMNSIFIGDWDLEYTPSLIIRHEDWNSYLDRDYDLSKIEDYMKMIEWSRYDHIDFLGTGSHSKFFRGGKAYDITLKDEKYTEGWTKEDFKPYHEDLISHLEDYHGQKLTY